MRRGRRTDCSSFRKSSNKDMDITALSITDLQARLRAKEVSPTEVLAALEARIARVDPLIHGYISRDFAAARRAAETADVSLPLGGVPVAIKDVINVKGEPCTAASKILLGYTSTYDATVISKLRAAQHTSGNMLLSRGLPGRQACVALCQVRRDHAARVGLVHPALLEGCQQALPHASLLTSYQRPHAPKVATTARAETAAPAIASATPATDRTDTDARAKGTTAATAHSARRRAERGAGEPGNVFRLRAWHQQQYQLAAFALLQRG